MDKGSGDLYHASRHRFAVFLTIAVVALIAAGALVKSKEAGLSVPDWPLSYGSLNPPQWWLMDGVWAEHGHRLFAGTIALLTLALCAWFYRREPRSWVKKLTAAAVATVFLQAFLGGLTVLLLLPTAVSVSHAGVAQLFLGLIVAIAVATSRAWLDEPGGQLELAGLRTSATVLSGLIYLQILVGALMRHSGAGLAIPDFPLAFGRLIPPYWNFGIAVHFAHRVGAVAVTVVVLVVFVQVLRGAREVRPVWWAALGLIALLLVQITLGATVVLTQKAVLPNTVHVAVGAALWAVSLVITLLAWRRVGRLSPVPQAAALRSAES